MATISKQRQVPINVWIPCRYTMSPTTSTLEVQTTSTNTTQRATAPMREFRAYEIHELPEHLLDSLQEMTQALYVALGITSHNLVQAPKIMEL
jgi:hypothetical protein